MISVIVEARGAMTLPFSPEHYLKALEPEGLPDLLRAIEPDARDVSMTPAATPDAYLLNIKGAIAGCAPFDAFYTVTYPREPRPHVNVQLTRYGNKDLAVTGRFFVQPAGSHSIFPSRTRKDRFMILHVEEWRLKGRMALLAIPLRLYLRWKVKAEVRRMGKYVAQRLGRARESGVGVSVSTAKITMARFATHAVADPS